MLSKYKYKNYFFLVDRCSIECLPIEIVDFIQKFGLLSSLNGHKISFCGLIAFHGVNYFFYPRQTDLDKVINDPIRHCWTLMQALLKFTQESKTKVMGVENGADSIGFEKLENLKSLVLDFQLHGIFRPEEAKILKNLGKTDWKRTINRSIPFPDSTNTPVYLDTYGRKRASIHNEITKIHANVLIDIFKKYGFIFLGAEEVPNVLKQYGTPSLSIKSQINLLRKEMQNHFADRQTRLLRVLINYLCEYKGNSENNSIIGVTRFHVAWEHMLYKRYFNVIDINSRLPKPVFINIDGHSDVAKKSGMRTDIVIEDKDIKQLTVLDAKYYDATNVDNSPGWSDLVKQFFYEKALAEMAEFRGYKIGNVLIFPGKKSLFKEIRMQDQESKKYLNEKFPPIQCVYVNPIHIMQDYLSNQKIQFNLKSP